ncbi:MAG: hypothetical protein BWY04_00342 [candidate division CPR1 bacterium ADurb.Bin160]|uniref:Uncharacterized protein n=1 Tax=candidate division CPR1 bacterium ADurb.Bin160 TaxID=1852826 RepID=A0A1V5ZQF5_9BACT|nr:MAG: hypothetical protein BWY04_00342 [candidate division CPR1 bacterium ADurb.Bin160]
MLSNLSCSKACAIISTQLYTSSFFKVLFFINHHRVFAHIESIQNNHHHNAALLSYFFHNFFSLNSNIFCFVSSSDLRASTSKDLVQDFSK